MNYKWAEEKKKKENKKETTDIDGRLLAIG